MEESTELRGLDQFINTDTIMSVETKENGEVRVTFVTPVIDAFTGKLVPWYETYRGTDAQ